MRNTQQKKILSLLSSRPYEWVPLPAIIGLGIAQYNARIKELRDSGVRIENKTEWVDGTRHSWFRLVPEKEEQLALF